MLAGGLAFAAAYGISAGAAIATAAADPIFAPTEYRPLAVPVAGPFMAIVDYTKQDHRGEWFPELGLGLFGVLFTLDGVVQIAGLVCLASGAILYASRSQPGTRVSVVPAAAGSGRGLVLVGTF